MQTATRKTAAPKGKSSNGHSMNGKHASGGLDKKVVNDIAKAMRTLREARATAGQDKSPEASGIVTGQLRMVARNLAKTADGIERGGE